MTAERPVVSVDTRLAETAGLNTAEIRRVAARETEGGLLVRDTIPALCDAVDGLRAAHDELLSQLRDARAENARLRGDVRRQTERADAVELIESRGRGLAQERAARAEAALATVRELVLQWDDLLQAQVAVMTTAQANARRDALCALSYALPAAEQDEPALPESMLTGPATFEFDEQEEDEPKRCEHGWTKAHTWCPHNPCDGTCYEWHVCPGPVSQPTAKQDETTVEIGGQVMTQAQFDAARHALAAEVPAEVAADVEPKRHELCDRPSLHTPHGIVGAGGFVHHCPGVSQPTEGAEQ